MPGSSPSLLADIPNVLLFKTAGRCYALPLSAVIECMRPLPVEPVTELPPWVLGLSRVRGEVLPVVDVAHLVSGLPAQSVTRFVTIRAGDRRVALALEAVTGVTHLTTEVANALPALLAGAAGNALEALGQRDGALLLVLDAGKLLPEHPVS